MTSRASGLLLSLALACVSTATEAADRDTPSAPASAAPKGGAPARPAAPAQEASPSRTADAAPKDAAPPRANDAAPAAPAAASWLAIPMLHRQAGDELKALLATVDKSTRDKLVGVYVAFDASTNDVGALAGCDDDGDYVVVVSDALLGILDGTSRAQAADKLDAYAAFVVRGARPHAKMAAPPAAFFDVEGGAASAQKRAEVQATRAREALSGVLAHELAHMIAGDVTCKRPSAAREAGDDTWTASEQARAVEVAEKAYTPQRVLAADSAGTTMMLDASRSAEGLVGLLSVLDRVERSAREGYAPTYLRLHPSTAARLQWVEAAATHWRQARTASVH